MLLREMVSQWRVNPDAVHPSWREFISSVIGSRPSVAKSLTDTFALLSDDPTGNLALLDSFEGRPDQNKDGKGNQLTDTMKAMSMIRHYEKNGHFTAKTDPLDLPLHPPYITESRYKAIHSMTNGDYTTFHFSEKDLDRPVRMEIPATGGFLGKWSLSDEDRLAHWAGKYVSIMPEASKDPLTIGHLYRRLRETYMGPIGVEFLHIFDRNKINWIRDHFETPEKPRFSKEMKLNILESTIRSVLFETFAAQKFATMKRFGLDGCESLIVGLRNLTNLASLLGVDNVLITMSHRGRLNTITNVMHKPAIQVFSEFSGNTTFGGTDWGNSGDVKYHMGIGYDFFDKNTDRNIKMSIIPNPSHLEAASSVLLGAARARQTAECGDDLINGQRRVLPISIHGDAALSGQGVVYESIQMSQLPGYSTGGTIHVAVNNQIGFTTPPGEGNSGNYCTDVAKAVEAPVFHVNADDPEAVTYVMEVAAKYRQKFLSDVFVDLVGYRRFGHNELDMPKFTNPVMYNKIANHPDVLTIYSQKLIKEGVLTNDEYKKLRDQIWKQYDDNYKQAKSFKPVMDLKSFSPKWRNMATSDQICAPRLTGVDVNVLRDLGSRISTIPKHIKPHPTIAKVYKTREKAIANGSDIDFGLAEALAFATLLKDGVRIRLGGQDSERGTFSHRHAVIHDQTSDSVHTPLVQLCKDKKFPESFEVRNSLLSEYAALGFEYGFSLEDPNWLTLWEAQFGDFANGAQIVTDQFISAGEVKWNQQSGLVMMLPHGYDGQGPEHSSGRLERFLTLCDDREDIISSEFWEVDKRSVIQKHNIQVCNVTTAAQLFHVLRRQIHRGFRKPLILFFSKKLLRFRDATSPLSDFAEGTRFARYIYDPTFLPPKVELSGDIGKGVGPNEERSGGLNARKDVQRLILCSGQVYYDLVKARQNAKLEDKVLISRVEQISPFPMDQLANDIRTLPNLQSVVWAQEEPMNQGTWSYGSHRIRAVLNHCKCPNGIQDVVYAGRDVAASTATGDGKIHQAELKNLLTDAMNLDRVENSYHERYYKPSCSPAS